MIIFYTKTLEDWLFVGMSYLELEYHVLISPIVNNNYYFSKSTIEREVEYLQDLSNWTNIKILLKVRR